MTMSYAQGAHTVSHFVLRTWFNPASSAERAVNEKLAETPEVYLLALVQLSRTEPNEVVSTKSSRDWCSHNALMQMRSFSLVLLRRLLFRALPSSPSTLRSARITLYDHLSEPTRTSLERALLSALANEPSQSVRPKLADTITDLAAASFDRGRPWLALQAQSFSATLNVDHRQRESAYRIFGNVPALMGDQQVDAIVRVLQRGLQDPESLEVSLFSKVWLATQLFQVRNAALRASAAYLYSASTQTQAQAQSLLFYMLDTLPALPSSRASEFIQTLTTPLASSPVTAHLFSPHLNALLTYLPPLILPQFNDPGPTPTTARPFPSNSPSEPSGSGTKTPNGTGPSTPTQGRPASSAFTFPPQQKSQSPSPQPREDHEHEQETRRAALELLVTLTEARPGMVKRVEGWVALGVRACLEGMGEIGEGEEGGGGTGLGRKAADEEEGLRMWLDADVSCAFVNTIVHRWSWLSTASTRSYR